MLISLKDQKGFTLQEFVLCLSVLAILAGALIYMYDSNKARAEVLSTKLADISAGLLRMKADTYCFPIRLDGLVTPSAAGNTFCGVVDTRPWKGPYIAVGTTFNQTTGNIQLDSILPGLEILLTRQVVGINVKWNLSTVGLTSELKTLVLSRCSNEYAGTSNGSRCYDAGANQIGFNLDVN